MNIGMRGFVRFETINKYSGKVTSDTGFFPNKILNAGLNIIGSQSSWLTHCQVGRSGTPPTATDTSLGDWFAATSNIIETTNGQQGAAPFYGWKRRKWRFGAGTTEANLFEAAFGYGPGGPGNPDSIISKALIVDPITQESTSVTPLADEILDVTYELRYYPPLGDTLGPQIMLLDTTYDTISRAANVTGTDWSNSIGSKIGILGVSWPAYDGDIGDITTGPNGTGTGNSVSANYTSAYLDNSYQAVMNTNIGSGYWNVAGGIRSCLIRTTAGAYQTQFNAVGTLGKISKSALHTMNMNWAVSWSEFT